LSPALAARPFFRNVPGCPGSGFGLALAVMFLMFSFSNRIRPYVRASMVEVFSHQSLRRSASRALSLAAFAYSAAFRSLPFGARAARRWCLRICARSFTVSWGS
jgi:hypothetical protein